MVSFLIERASNESLRDLAKSGGRTEEAERFRGIVLSALTRGRTDRNCLSSPKKTAKAGIDPPQGLRREQIFYEANCGPETTGKMLSNLGFVSTRMR
jgi:hypothetical protein